jgi:hypothetical protein
MSGIRRIGFIGMGNMGVPMAANLVLAGYAVTAFDIAGGRAEDFAKEHNARAAGSPAALGQYTDVVITMLPSGREVRQVLLEAEDGALVRNLRAGSTVIDMSSADPVGTRRLGAELAAHRIELVDAPVSGGVPRAKDGTLAIMIGGSAGAVQAVKPLLSKMGSRLFEVGGLGCGHAMKEQLSRRDLVCRGERSGAGRAHVRARPCGDDRRDQRVDRAKLPDRSRHETARAERNVCDGICARASRQGRRDRRRSRVAGRRRCADRADDL